MLMETWRVYLMVGSKVVRLVAEWVDAKVALTAVLKVEQMAVCSEIEKVVSMAASMVVSMAE